MARSLLGKIFRRPATNFLKTACARGLPVRVAFSIKKPRAVKPGPIVSAQVSRTANGYFLRALVDFLVAFFLVAFFLPAPFLAWAVFC